MNWAGAGYCGGCGRQLGLEPMPDVSELHCPSCTIGLSAFAGGAPGRLYDCARCGGQLVEHALLRDLLERREVCGAAVPRRTMRRESELEPVRYLPCPGCRALMNRQNFGGASGVIVDVCSRHGVWFDAGELPRVLEFVEDGGLARSRRRQLEERYRAERAKELASEGTSRVLEPHISGTQAQDPVAFSSPPAWKTGLWDDAKEALHELGELIAKRTT
jgi:Zn-finger nucleic acid-binding protein